MILLDRPGPLRRLLGAILLVVLALLLVPAVGFTGDGPLISCQTCYDQYPDWWCVYAWGCPWPAGGGGGSGAQVVKR